MRPLPVALAIVSLVAVNASEGLRAETHHIAPQSFATAFSATQPPAARIRSGDRVVTTTLDGAGADAKGISVSKDRRPLTGPFFVDGAAPGDLLVVTIEQLRPNRLTGFSSGVINGRAIAEALNSNKQTAPTSWAIDVARNVVRLDLDSALPGTDWRGRFQSTLVELPLQPMLGAIGVAPAAGVTADAGAAGLYGGSVSYTGVAPGTRVMLPVSHAGAFLYLGDGKARQGDGDITGTGISTSLDVTFSVEVVKKKEWPHSSVIRPSTVVGEFEQGAPRLETSEFLMTMGAGPSLSDALQIATLELHHWLDDDFGLSERSVSLLMGPTLEYEIASVSGTQVTIVAKIRKAFLPQPLEAR